MTVCPKHGDVFGLMWKSGKPPRTCSHPLHVTSGKAERGVSVKVSEEIMEHWNRLVPIGSGI